MGIRLEPMTEKDFNVFLETAIREYADDKVKAGNWAPEEALERSRQEHASLLPQGVASPDNYLFNIVDDANAKTVGIIWFAVLRQGTRPYAYIYNIRIDDEYQRKGFGRQAMLAVEEEVKALGLDTLALHVFGYNHAARALYEQLGYEITNINMLKKL